MSCPPWVSTDYNIYNIMVNINFLNKISVTNVANKITSQDINTEVGLLFYEHIWGEVKNMKNKFVGICFCILLITTCVLPVCN